MGTQSQDLESKYQEARAEGGQCIAIGVGVGALGALAAAAMGAVCPVCVVAAPALVGIGVYRRATAKKILGEKLPTEPTDTSMEQHTDDRKP